MFEIALILFILTSLMAAGCIASLTAERRRYSNDTEREQFIRRINESGIDWTRHTFIWFIIFGFLTVAWSVLSVVVTVIQVLIAFIV